MKYKTSNLSTAQHYKSEKRDYSQTKCSPTYIRKQGVKPIIKNINWTN